MAGPITLGSIPAALKPGVNKFYGMTYEQYPTQYSQIYQSVNTEENFIKHVNVNGFGLAMKKHEGEDVKYDSLAQGFVKYFEPAIYAIGFRVTHEHIRDNKYIELANHRAAAAARSMVQTKERLAAEPLNFATSASSPYAMADGLALLSASHKLSKGGTFSNVLSTASDLSQEALEQADIELGDIVDDSGLKINLMPRRLIVPRELKYEAMRILDSDKEPDSANNAINPVKSSGLIPSVMVHQYLTDDDMWFLQTNSPDGLMHFQREGSMSFIDTDFDSRDVKTIFMESYVFGVTDPRSIFGSVPA